MPAGEGDAMTVRADDVMTGFPVPAHLRVTAATAYERPFVRWFMQHVREVERSASVGSRAEHVAQLPVALRDLGKVCVKGVDGGLAAAPAPDGDGRLHRAAPRRRRR